MDPTQPYVRHQLARILFLKSELVGALSLVTQEIELFKEQASPSSYYVRGLIYGYMDDFKKAAVDYEVYLKSDVNNWAAINDYAWVLIQDNRSHDALNALNWGLSSWPDNPWLLNSKVVALYELGRFDDARTVAAEALKATQNIQPAQWSQAYPGNDPRIAREGVFALQESVRSNMHSILKTYRSTTTSVTY
jgi:tetratricopeptide (TPR) repeat protein